MTDKTDYPEPRCFLAFEGTESTAFLAHRLKAQTGYAHGYTGGEWALDTHMEIALKDILRDEHAVDELTAILSGAMTRDARGRLIITNDGDTGWPMVVDVCDADVPVFEVSIREPGSASASGPWVPTTMTDLSSLTTISADELWDMMAPGEPISLGEDDGCFLPGDLAGGAVEVRPYSVERKGVV